MRVRRLALYVTGLTLLGLALASSASAYIYWNNDATKTIGRANLDGTSVDNNFVATAYGSCSVATNGSYVYWTYDNGAPGNQGGYVGRASTATRVAENQFIHTQDGLPCGVAVDSAHVYWNNYFQGIGRADLNGTVGSINQTFINTPNDNVQHPSVDAGHIYYSEKGNASIGRGPIGGGAGTENFITPTDNPPSGTAVDGQYVYWGNFSGYIGRATLDGTTLVQPHWLNTGHGVCAIAVDSGHIYWGRYGDPTNGGYIGRATIDGNPASVNPTFIHTAGNTCGVAVDSGAPPPPPPANTFTIEPRVSCAFAGCKVILVKVTFDSAGNVIAEEDTGLAAADPTASASKKKKKHKALLKTLSQAVTAGANTLKLTLTKTAVKQLKKKHKLTIKVLFVFTPTGGTPRSQVQVFTIKLKKKKKH